MSNTITITLDPPLHCSLLLARQRRCGQPATAAQATTQADGSYRVLAICAQCLAAMEPRDRGEQKVRGD